jgi:hypothetical protein
MKMKHIPLQTSIADLFRGWYRSYVRCTNVEFGVSRVEEFYDLSLVDVLKMIWPWRKTFPRELTRKRQQTRFFISFEANFSCRRYVADTIADEIQKVEVETVNQIRSCENARNKQSRRLVIPSLLAYNIHTY